MPMNTSDVRSRSDVPQLEAVLQSTRTLLIEILEFTSGMWRRCEQAVLSRVATSRAELTFLIVLVAASFLLRFWGVSHLHIWDENVYLLNAEKMLTGSAPYDEVSSRPPLLPLLFAGAFRLWHSDYAAWMVATGLNAAGPLFMYLAGRSFIGRFPAMLAALMLGFSPYMANAFIPGSADFQGDNTGHSLMTDCPALTLVLLAFWLMIRALQVPTAVRFGAAGLALAAAGLMRFGSFSSICILALLPLAAPRRVRSLGMCLAGFLVGVTPYLSWSYRNYGGLFYTLRDGWANFGGPAESSWFYVDRLTLIFSGFAVAGLLLWALCSLFAVWTGQIDGPRLQGTTGALPLPPAVRQIYLIFWAVALFCCFSALSHKEPRYILPAAAPVYLLSGVGWQTIFSTHRPLARACGTIAMLAAFAACLWTDRMRLRSSFIGHDTNEEMTVSAWIRDHTSARTVLFAASSYPDFAYYSGRTTIPLPSTGRELDKALEKVPEGSLVIVYRYEDDGRPGEPSLSWLQAHPSFHLLHSSSQISLYRVHYASWPMQQLPLD